MTNIQAVPLADLEVGDTITAEFEDADAGKFIVTGTLCSSLFNSDLMLAGWVVCHGNRNHGPSLQRVTKRVPVEPGVGATVIDEDGDYWVHLPEGWVLIGTARERAVGWTKVVDENPRPVTP